MRHFILLSLFSLILSPTVFAKVFIYCSEGSPTAFNPQITTDGTSNNAAAYTIYNRLVEFEYGSTKVVPGLASSWTISKDKQTYTFKLRKNVPFHKTKYFTPTRNFDARDVLFSFNRQRLKKHPYHKVGGGSYEYFSGMDMPKLIKDIVALDSHTVQITLNWPEAPFLANMAMSFMSILSKEYGDHLSKKNKKSDIDHYPVGTGPFIFKKYVKDSTIRYTKNKKYFLTPAKIDKLVFSITPDASVRYQKLKTGECHLVFGPSPSDLGEMKKNKKIKVVESAGLNVGYLAFNVTKAPFNNPLVRQAINHALNKKSYIKAIYLGLAQVAKNPLPPTLWSYNDKIEDYSYNPKKAKELLKKAGHAKGITTEIWALPVTRPYNPNGKKMAELMQADLKKVGITAKIVSYDWSTYLSKARNGEHQMIQLGWTGDNGDPDNFLNILLGCTGAKSGSNASKWCHKKFDDLVTKAKKITDIKARTKLYEQAQVIFKKEAPWVPLAHSTVFKAMSKKVKGYKVDPLGGDIFTFVEL
jgi:dipeptide transport system substrate-binding protein